MADKKVLLSVLTSDIKLDEAKLSSIKSSLTKSLGAEEFLSASANTFEISVVVSGSNEKNILTPLAKALSEQGVSSGSMDIALVKASKNDPDFEAPPFYEATLNVADILSGKAFEKDKSGNAEYMVDIFAQEQSKGTPFTDDQIKALQEKITTKYKGCQFVKINSGSTTDSAVRIIHKGPKVPEKDLEAQFSEICKSLSISTVAIRAQYF